MTIASLILLLAALYTTLGLLFTPLFLLRLVHRLDPAIAHSPRTVRLLLIPGVVALWPLLITRSPLSRSPLPRSP